MTELEVAQQVRDGQLPSPTQLGGMTLFNLRVTGTGVSYRPAHDEFVLRDPELYLNDEFLQRCNGLPVIWDHPVDTDLNSNEFAKRVIGTVMLPFIRDKDVWAVCRIYDQEAIEAMSDGQLSTSPGVVFKAADGNKTIELDDGNVMLIEGKPSILDHLAVCSVGVWDKQGPPVGVQNDLVTPSTSDQELIAMGEQDKAVADQARMDTALQTIADSLGKLVSRMDSMEADSKSRKDAEEAAKEEERKDRARHDAARKDKFGARKDGESYKDYKARHDADEMSMMDALEKEGCVKDKARKDARSARHDAEEDEKRGDASFEEWANEEEKEEAKSKKDASEEEEEKKEEKKDNARKDAKEDNEEDCKDSARKDAVNNENAELKAQIASLEARLNTITAETPASDRDAMAKAQSRADGVAAMFGERAPAPIPGETPLAYRKRLVTRFQRHSEKYKESRLDALDGPVLEPIEDRIYADAIVSARSPADAAPGRLIEFTERDRAGRTITKYAGDIGAFMAPFMTGATVGRVIRNPKGA